MYLSKRTYIGANYEHRKITGLLDIRDIEGKRFPIQLHRVSEIIEQIGYWRKSNQIHNWFVTNVQGGVDECQESHVPREKLEELLAICEEAIKTKNPAKLSPAS